MSLWPAIAEGIALSTAKRFFGWRSWSQLTNSSTPPPWMRWLRLRASMSAVNEVVMDAIMDRLGRNSLMTIACRTPHAGSFTAQQNDPVTSHECAALWSLNRC